ncbi:hypothetical protein FIBSPDRAFT_131474 [Athelia psychrophila]|uniref:Uncharacterized protein n=1 Tax=Athelia psychrophila TaxID=1759441 RepID=A0A166CD06_9AGAM|nr:hypothetical protein FIBSPDRAFT_131474 [Fibularhizoctonia sp. CBS 109695]
MWNTVPACIARDPDPDAEGTFSTSSPPWRDLGLRTLVPIRSTSPSSRSNHIVSHFPFPNHCAPPPLPPPLQSSSLCPPRYHCPCWSPAGHAPPSASLPPKLARAPRSSPTANQRLLPRYRRAHQKATYQRTPRGLRPILELGRDDSGGETEVVDSEARMYSAASWGTAGGRSEV